MGKHRKHRSKKHRRSSPSYMKLLDFYNAFKDFQRKKRKRSPSSSSSDSSQSSTHENESQRKSRSKSRSDPGSSSSSSSASSSSGSSTHSSPHRSASPPMVNKTMLAEKSVRINTPAEMANGSLENTGEKDTAVVPEAVHGLFGNSRVQQKVFAPPLYEKLAKLWEEVICLGLTETDRKALAAKYPIMSNCEFLEPPKVNDIIKNAVAPQVIERDDRLVAKQNRFKVCLAAVGKALMPLIHSQKEEEHVLVEILCDVGRCLADGFYEENAIRRHLLIQTVNEAWRNTLRRTVSNEWLFGPKLEEQLQAAKTLAKSVEELKQKKPVPPKNAQLPPHRFTSKTKGGGQSSTFQKPAPPQRYQQPQKQRSSSSSYNRSSSRSNSRNRSNKKSRSNQR